jgi:hypothetical protein
MTKIKNWFKEHNYIAGIALLFVSLCTLAFGGAYFGATKAINDYVDDDSTQEVDEEFTFE